MNESPYRSYLNGQSVMPIGNLQRRMDGYYPASNGKSIIEFVDECQYKIRPIGYDDLLEAVHWELLPAMLIRTRFYVPSNLVRTGVVVRPINDLIRRMVIESDEHEIQYTDGTIGNVEPVEILRMSDDPDDILYYLKGSI